MYKNLIYLMAKKKIRQYQVAKLLDISARAVYQKTHGLRDFKLTEAFKVRDEFFPELSLEYLFEKEA